jgi:hypothetical protein
VTVRSIEAWVRSDAMGALLATFEADLPDGSVEETLDQLEAFSALRWDRRGGKERNLAEAESFDDETAALIAGAARALGLAEQRPPRSASYDHVLVLGGLVRASLVRPAYARELIDKGLDVGDVTALGAFRPLGGDEIELAAGAGVPDARNEIEAMEAGMRRAFGVAEPVDVAGGDDDENPNLSWRVARYGGDPPLALVAAPTTDPSRRANTPDTYRYWATEVVGLTGERAPSVLVVTSAIYVPFQGADAIRMLSLPYGAEVETIGVDMTALADPSLRQEFTPSNYLQEIRSAIRSLRALLQALPSR